MCHVSVCRSIATKFNSSIYDMYLHTSVPRITCGQQEFKLHKDNLQNIMCANFKLVFLCVRRNKMDYDCERVFLMDGMGLRMCVAAI